MEAEYIYLGDRHTSVNLKKAPCAAVRRDDGKCIRGKNGSMLVEFSSGKAVILARLLRKVGKPNSIDADERSVATEAR